MDNIPTTIVSWYEKATHFCLQREIAQKIALMHQGLTPQNTHPNFTHRPQTSCTIHDPNTMDIDALNLSPVERSHCLRNHLCFICKRPNCSTRNHPCEDVMTCPAQQEPTLAHPTHNPERVQTTTSTSTLTPEEGDLAKYIKELEGKGRNPTELLQLLQIVIEAEEKDEVSF